MKINQTTEDRLFQDQIRYYAWLFDIIGNPAASSVRVLIEAASRNHRENLSDYNR